MKRLKIASGLVLTAGLVVFSTSPALGARWEACLNRGAGNGKWLTHLCNTRNLSGSEEFATGEVVATLEDTSSTSPGQFLEIEDEKATGGPAKLKCKERNAGWIGANGQDGITSYVATECERVTGSCEAGTARIVAVNLPWQTVARTEPNGEIRDRLTGEGAGPGYSVECRVGGFFKIADTCVGETTTLLRNSTAVPGEVEAELETKTAKTNCTMGGMGAGKTIGILLLLGRLSTLPTLGVALFVLR